jgi:hypothetical protein
MKIKLGLKKADIKLDEFSYTIFKNHMESIEGYITIKLALEYLTTLYTLSFKVESEKILIMKYLNIVMDKTKTVNTAMDRLSLRIQSKIDCPPQDDLSMILIHRYKNLVLTATKNATRAIIHLQTFVNSLLSRNNILEPRYQKLANHLFNYSHYFSTNLFWNMSPNTMVSRYEGDALRPEGTSLPIGPAALLARIMANAQVVDPELLEITWYQELLSALQVQLKNDPAGLADQKQIHEDYIKTIAQMIDDTELNKL